MNDERQEAQAINQADAFTTVSLAVIEAQRTLLSIGSKLEQLQNLVGALNAGAGNRLKALEDIVMSERIAKINSQSAPNTDKATGVEHKLTAEKCAQFLAMGASKEPAQEE